MTNKQLIERIASLNMHQLHIESLETLLRNAIDRQSIRRDDEKSSHRLRIESCLRVERELQDQELNAFRIDMKE